MQKNYSTEEELNFFMTKVELFKNKKIRIEDLFYSVNTELPLNTHHDLFFDIALLCKDIKDKKFFLETILDKRIKGNENIEIVILKKILDIVCEEDLNTGINKYKLKNMIPSYKFSNDLAMFVLNKIDNVFYNKYKDFILDSNVNHLYAEKDTIRIDIIENYKNDETFPFNFYLTFETIRVNSSTNLKNIPKSIAYWNQHEDNFFIDYEDFYEDESFLNSLLCLETEEDVTLEEKKNYIQYVTGELKKNNIGLIDIFPEEELLHKMNKMDNQLFECFIDLVFEENNIEFINFLRKNMATNNFASKDGNFLLNQNSLLKKITNEEKEKISEHIHDVNNTSLLNKKRI